MIRICSTRCMLAALALLLSSLAQAEEIRVKVTRIIDGDTVVVLSDQHEELRVRLAGIDCPEKRRNQPYWRFAKDALSDRVAGRTITVDFDKRDRWGRLIGVLWLNNQDVNAELVGIGACWHFKKYQHEQSESDQVRYHELELSARQRHIGLWADRQPIAPWDWRKQKTTNGG